MIPLHASDTGIPIPTGKELSFVVKSQGMAKAIPNSILYVYISWDQYRSNLYQ